jgi:hypothetical protein
VIAYLFALQLVAADFLSASMLALGSQEQSICGSPSTTGRIDDGTQYPARAHHICDVCLFVAHAPITPVAVTFPVDQRSIEASRPVESPFHGAGADWRSPRCSQGPPSAA